MTKSVANIVMSRMRLHDVTVKEWAEANRYKPDTVYKTIHGIRGKTERGESARIREDLRRDGYWPDDEAFAGSAPADEEKQGLDPRKGG